MDNNILLDPKVCIHVFLNIIIFEYFIFQNNSIFIFKKRLKVLNDFVQNFNRRHC